MKRPLFSIISPAMNSLEFLPRNIASIRAQGICNAQVEHWVIDGGSTDGSVEYLSAQEDTLFVSERDRGLSHAVNKGIERATGEWVIWLNADDELAPDALQKFAANVNTQDRIITGSQEVRNYVGEFQEITAPRAYTASALLNERTDIIQASTFVHREVYREVGGLDGTYRYAMDFEWMVRALQIFPCGQIDDVLTIYHRRRGSITDVGIAGQVREFLRVRREQGCLLFGAMDFRLWCYLLVDPLRQIDCLRSGVRSLKHRLTNG
ncbi:MAG: glycosyltransferase [Verrucomicrobiia bacterium]|jgi:glycosyltransferase involved in cell wall biosynthesis